MTTRDNQYSKLRQRIEHEDPEERVGLSSYLKGLGLEDAQISKVVPLLRSPGEEERRTQAPQRDRREASMTKPVKLYLAEEQQMLLKAYQSFFESHPSVEVVGSSGDTATESLIGAALALKPDVLLVGVKTLQPSTVEKLESFREHCSDVAFVLLSAFYDVQGIKALREFLKGSTVGCAYLLKHTIDTVEQLSQVVSSAKEGRVTLDPTIMEGLINAGEAHNTFLKELSPRELEVLSWMAKGYRNETIAAVLSREPKTVERHINSIYSKLQDVVGSRHPRVHAVLLYLKAAGLLSAEIGREE